MTIDRSSFLLPSTMKTTATPASSSKENSGSSSSSSSSTPALSSSPRPAPPFPVLSGLAVGTLFGVALEKSKVFYPTVIRAQMTLDSFIMMKTFLSATATGLIVIAVMERRGLLTRLNRVLIRFVYLYQFSSVLLCSPHLRLFYPRCVLVHLSWLPTSKWLRW